MLCALSGLSGAGVFGYRPVGFKVVANNHKAEIEAREARDDAFAKEMRAKTPSPLAEKLAIKSAGWTAAALRRVIA